MPKYRVLVHQTEVYEWNVAADGEAAARRQAIRLQSRTYANAVSSFLKVPDIQVLDDDTEVDN